MSNEKPLDVDRILREANLPDLHKSIEELEMRRLMQLGTKPPSGKPTGSLAPTRPLTDEEAKREANRLLVEHFAYVTELPYVNRAREPNA